MIEGDRWASRRQRRALVLRDWRVEATTRSGRSLGLSQGAVRQLVHRARSSVRPLSPAVTPTPVAASRRNRGQRPIGERGLKRRRGRGRRQGARRAALLAGGAAGGAALAPGRERGRRMERAPHGNRAPRLARQARSNPVAPRAITRPRHRIWLPGRTTTTPGLALRRVPARAMAALTTAVRSAAAQTLQGPVAAEIRLDGRFGSGFSGKVGPRGAGRGGRVIQ